MPHRHARLHARRPRGGRVRRLALAGLGAVVAVNLASGAPVRAGDTGPGRVTAVGAAVDLGSAAGRSVAGIARTPSGKGYWLAGADGGVFAFGDATFRGALTGAAAHDVTDIAATPSGRGYWLAGEDGGVFAFGDAPFLGAALDAGAPVVGIAGTPSGQGYWVATEDGGVVAFGDAGFFGSATTAPVDQDVVAIAATPSGRGYRLLGTDGGVYSFGDAAFAGAPAGTDHGPWVDLVTAPEGNGYWTVSASGDVRNFGSAAALPATAVGGAPVTAAAGTPAGDGLWMTTGGRAIGTFGVSCYALRGHTATGAPVAADVVAVDPHTVPLGSRIFVDGLGVKRALDTGGRIRGKRLDMWHPSVSYCRQFGMKKLNAYLMG